jgi:hypothetical protein
MFLIDYLTLIKTYSHISFASMRKKLRFVNIALMSDLMSMSRGKSQFYFHKISSGSQATLPKIVEP